MPTVKEPPVKEDGLTKEKVKSEVACYHCGAPCITNNYAVGDKVFCCDGCKLVYEILDENGLCNYYKIQNHPGLTQVKARRSDKYAYLDNADISQKLLTFSDGKHAVVTLYIPGIHCSSCMWLLEHLPKIRPAITDSRLNFTNKEVTIHYLQQEITLREIVDLLTTIGYEPYISLEDGSAKKAKASNKKKVYKLGVAGFCFGNIMMLSFPEYLSGNLGIEHQYVQLFRYLNLVLALPVFFFSASEFFTSAWAGLKQKMLNIDAPIVLALIITFGRSLYEIFTNTGSGYLDSMSGIVFFMLVGRLVQDQAYKSISFNRDYKSYFPIAVNVVTDSGTEAMPLQDLKEKDVVELHNDEIIPADGVVLKGNANIDYGFVTGESEPVKIGKGNIVYAGGKQKGDNLTIQLIKPVAGSYLTSLWNHYSFSKNKQEENNNKSIIHVLSKYFTIILFVLAGITAAFWALNNPAKLLPSVSAMLIVACPCALLLSANYTNGNLLRLLSNNGLFLRDATVIEQLGKVDHIIFDKTGTLTQGSSHFSTSGHELTDYERRLVYSVIQPSSHPYSKALSTFLGSYSPIPSDDWKEFAGKGISAYIDGNLVKVGSAIFVGVDMQPKDVKPSLYIRINDDVTAFYINPVLRDAVPQLIPQLASAYDLSMLSGDNDAQRSILKGLFGNKGTLLFEQKPHDKLRYIETLQKGRHQTLMIGDGLNDAGALQQSNVGITLADDINNFSPSCDAILDASKMAKLPSLLRLSRWGKYIIGFSFLVSIVYNIIGLTISMQGNMSPMKAAILMPVSTLSIVLISTGVSSIVAAGMKLSLKSQ
jgi:Cu+-exporting ATPase